MVHTDESNILFHKNVLQTFRNPPPPGVEMGGGGYMDMGMVCGGGGGVHESGVLE